MKEVRRVIEGEEPQREYLSDRERQSEYMAAEEEKEISGVDYKKSVTLS